MTQNAAMVANESQNDWDVHLAHVESACNGSVSVATGLSPNDVHITRPPRLFLAIFEHSYA